MASTVKISSKSELASLAQTLLSKAQELESSLNSIKSTLNSISDYDGINVSGAAKTLSNNYTNVSKDLVTVATNINNYASQIMAFDVNDFSSSGGLETYLDSVSGTVITLPAGLGSVHTYMGWQLITARSSAQYKLKEKAGMNFDSEGFGKIGDRYVVATTTTYGNVGDYIDVVQEDGSVLKCIIGDIKNQNDPGCNKWGHDNGECVVEFVVDKNSWYSGGGHANPGTGSCHPEWNQNITQIINKGSYFNNTDKPVNTSSYASSGSSSSYSGNSYSGSSYSGGSYSYQSSSKGSSSGYMGAAVAATTSTLLSGTTNFSGYGGSNGSTSNNQVENLNIQNNISPDESAQNTSVVQPTNTNIDITKYHNNLAHGFEVTVGNKVYELSNADYELLCAIVSAESDQSYDDALAVITTILNRCEAPNWVASYGTDPVKQATAPNQFVVYQHGSYKKYMGGNAPETVQTAVADALAGVRNHEYLSFRSNGSTGYSSNTITSSGNRYK